MGNPNQKQDEIDGLREQLRLLRHEHEANLKELEALRSGKTEARRIAEAAEMAAADRDAWKKQYEELAARYADLDLAFNYFAESTSPPAELMTRIYKAREGRKLDNGVPAKAPATEVRQ